MLVSNGIILRRQLCLWNHRKTANIEVPFGTAEAISMYFENNFAVAKLWVDCLVIEQNKKYNF